MRMTSDGSAMTVGLKSFMESTVWVRTGVAVAPTTIAADAAGFGAFTSAKINRGSFLGTYGAPCWRRANGVTPYRGANDYVMQAGGWRAAPPTGAKANVFKYPMMALQEPPRGCKANVAFIFFGSAGEIGVRKLPKSRRLRRSSRSRPCRASTPRRKFRPPSPSAMSFRS